MKVQPQFTPASIKTHLEQTGWKFCHSTFSGETWYKQFLNSPQCKANTDRPGKQVEIIAHHHLGKFLSLSITLTGQKPDDTWVTLNTYGITETEFLKIMDEQIKQLLAAWETMCEFAQDDEAVKKFPV